MPSPKLHEWLAGFSVETWCWIVMIYFSCMVACFGFFRFHRFPKWVRWAMAPIMPLLFLVWPLGMLVADIMHSIELRYFTDEDEDPCPSISPRGK